MKENSPVVEEEICACHLLESLDRCFGNKVSDLSCTDTSGSRNLLAASLTDSEQSSVRHARAGEHFPNRVIAAFLLQTKFLSHFFQLLLHYRVASANTIEFGNASSGRFNLAMSEFVATGLWEEAVIDIRTRGLVRSEPASTYRIPAPRTSAQKYESPTGILQLAEPEMLSVPKLMR